MTINIEQFRDAFKTVAGDFKVKSRPFETRQYINDMLYVDDGKGVLITKSRCTQLDDLKRDCITQGFRALLAEIPTGSKIVTCLPMLGNDVIEYAHFIDDATGLLFEIQIAKGYRRMINQLAMTWGVIP